MKSIYQKFIQSAKHARDFPLLFMRLIVAQAFWNPALMKWKNIENTTYWFESMNYPFPKFSVYLSASTEMMGVFLLLLGLGSRIIAIPLMIVLIVALLTVHWKNGWLAIADSSNPEISKRLDQAKELLKEHGDYGWLTEEGNFVILNNGIEFPVIYITMLLAIFAFGPGKFSLDYLISRFVK